MIYSKCVFHADCDTVFCFSLAHHILENWMIAVLLRLHVSKWVLHLLTREPLSFSTQKCDVLATAEWYSAWKILLRWTIIRVLNMRRWYCFFLSHSDKHYRVIWDRTSIGVIRIFEKLSIYKWEGCGNHTFNELNERVIRTGVRNLFHRLPLLVKEVVDWWIFERQCFTQFTTAGAHIITCNPKNFKRKTKLAECTKIVSSTILQNSQRQVGFGSGGFWVQRITKNHFYDFILHIYRYVRILSVAVRYEDI